jgi:hypothetical protein
MASLISSSKGPVVSSTPRCQVEYLGGKKEHRCWALTNIDLLAPFTIPMWQTWLNLNTKEVEQLKKNAIYGSSLLWEA